MYLIRNDAAKLNIQAKSQEELTEKLRYLNPLLLRIAQQCLEKEYRLHIEDSGEKLSLKPMSSIPVEIVFVGRKQTKTAYVSEKH